MKRLVLTLVALTAINLGIGSAALAQAGPEFKLGFKALADQIPEVVGQPLENEHWGPNGDSLQMTSMGLMAWRKADNWTAFTNGSRTWVNGPSGVQERANDQRFEWEKDAAPATAEAPTPPTSPSPTPRPTAPSPTPTPARSYTPDVKAMDEQAGGHGVAVKQMMSEVDPEWARVWGWRPSRPTTIYLYSDGDRMADALPVISGIALTTAQRDDLRKRVGLATVDRTTLGWAVMMNLSAGMGTPSWLVVQNDTLIHEYSHVMQRDVAGGAGPTWFLEGMAQVCAYSRVMGSPLQSYILQTVADQKRAGTLVSLRRLQDSWDGGAVGYGLSYMAVQVLAEKVGGAPLLEVLKRAKKGENFESALRAVTGYTLEQLDAEVQRRIQ